MRKRERKGRDGVGGVQAYPVLSNTLTIMECLCGKEEKKKEKEKKKERILNSMIVLSVTAN